MHTVLECIKDTPEWRSLGIHLGVKSSKLDEIARYPVGQQKSLMVQAWFDSGLVPTWDKLYEALQKPSVVETQAAERVDCMRRPSLVSASLCGDSVSKDSPLESDKSN